MIAKSTAQSATRAGSFPEPGRWLRSKGQWLCGISSALAIVIASIAGVAIAMPSADQEWQTVDSSDGSNPAGRHEAGAVVVAGKIYLFGGRGRGAGTRPVDRYDPQSNRWQRVSSSPMELHHFQPVAIGSKVYLVGAFTCCYPEEVSVAEIHVFDTSNNTWSTERELS